MYVVLVKDI